MNIHSLLNWLRLSRMRLLQWSSKASHPLRNILLLPFVLLCGCTAMIHDAVVDTYPSYAEAMKAAPALPSGYGRIVVYYPRLPAAGLGSGGAGIQTVTVDKTEKTHVGDQTFVFIDLPAGPHSVSNVAAGGGMFSTSYDTSVQLKAGETLFVELVAEVLDRQPPKVVPADQAQQKLADVRHNYKLAMPFNQQPRGSSRAF